MRAWPIVISAFVHLTLFCVFIFNSVQKIESQNFTSVEINVVEKIPQSKFVQLGAEQAKYPSSLNKKPFQLFPTHTSVINRFLAQKVTTHLGESSSPNSYPEFDSAAGLSMDQIGSIKSLWNEVDKSIEDNPYLSEFGYTGTVQLKFELTPDGKIADRTLRVDAINPILKVIALRALRKALRNENQELRLPPQNIVLTAQFTWSDYETCRSLKGTYRKALSFCSYAENKLKNYSGKEMALTYLKSLNYGFGAGEEIEKYHREESRRKNGFDPFEQYRRDPDWTTGS